MHPSPRPAVQPCSAAQGVRQHGAQETPTAPVFKPQPARTAGCALNKASSRQTFQQTPCATCSAVLPTVLAITEFYDLYVGIHQPLISLEVMTISSQKMRTTATNAIPSCCSSQDPPCSVKELPWPVAAELWKQVGLDPTGS